MALLAYQVYCPNSGQTALAGCACEDAGHDVAAAGVHHDRCPMNNLTANLACAGTAQCCGDAAGTDHDCEAVANACPGGHGDCPEPADCKLWASVKAAHTALVAQFEAVHGPLDQDPAGLSDEALGHAVMAADKPPDDCPGGHCHKDIADCTVHHPVIIMAGQGAAVLRPVAVAS
jgi:hypothetical protein